MPRRGAITDDVDAEDLEVKQAMQEFFRCVAALATTTLLFAHVALTAGVIFHVCASVWPVASGPCGPTSSTVMMFLAHA